MRIDTLGSSRLLPFLKLQSRFPRRIGERLHAPMVQITATVENHFADSLFLGTLAPPLCRSIWRHPRCRLYRADLSRWKRRRPAYGPAVVDHLGVNMIDAAKNRKPRTLRRAGHAAANALVNPRPNIVLRNLRAIICLPPRSCRPSCEALRRCSGRLYSCTDRADAASGFVMQLARPPACHSQSESSASAYRLFKSTPFGKSTSIGCE